MPESKQRRSPRHALELPIRVFGTDFEGRDFVEDSTTLAVNRNEAEIRLRHKLIFEEEIRILYLGNNREALFRVVSQTSEPTGEFSFWGVECLEPDENIWEGGLPKAGRQLDSVPGPQRGARPGSQLDATRSSQDKSLAQVTLRCSKCGMRELMDLDETQIRAMRKLKGLVRDCPACGATGLWKGVAGHGP